MIDQKILKYFLRYNPETGIFRWNHVQGNVHQHSLAGYTHSSGYRRISVAGKKYRAGRLAHLYMTGQWPNPQIDHINRNRNDDRWSNLREVTNLENAWNKPNAPAVPFPGVHLCNGRYRAQIKRGSKNTHLGYFKTAELAAAAYQAAAVKLDKAQSNVS